jgi:branched-chain amino acid transport system permease protein
MFVQQLINGLSLGSIYALIALGYTMVYGIVLLINFAHGDILMAGAYVGFFVLTYMGVSPLSLIAAFAVAMAFCAVLGVVIERFAYRPLRSAPRLNSLITAIAVSLILQNGARILLSANPRQFQFKNAAGEDFIIKNIQIHTADGEGFLIPGVQLIVIVVSAILMLLLNYIINHTKQGKAMRSVSFDMPAASLMGISVDKTISFTFALGSALAAAGGMLFAFSYPQISPTMGSMPGLKAFVAAVLGGIGSIPGAMAGGIILGVTETLAKGFMPSQYADAISFSILILILLLKPTGIMGAKHHVKV